MFDREVESSYKTLVQGRNSAKHSKAGPVTKSLPALLSVKAVDEKNRRITALASTGDIDRDNEIILPEAFRETLPEYLAKNNVVLCSHQYRLETGQSSVVANIPEAKITEDGLLVIIEFHNITELAEEYWQLYSQKKQRALSIGIIPQEGEVQTIKGRRIYVHTKVELLEVSVVAVPSNRDALSLSKRKKLAWLDEKKEQKRAEEFAAIILGEKKTGIPIVDEEPRADYIDSDDSEDSRSLDFAGIIKGTACTEFAKIIKGQ